MSESEYALQASSLGWSTLTCAEAGAQAHAADQALEAVVTVGAAGSYGLPDSLQIVSVTVPRQDGRRPLVYEVIIPKAR